MSQTNPEKSFHNTAYSVQLPNLAGHFLLNFEVKAFSTKTNILLDIILSFGKLTIPRIQVKYFRHEVYNLNILFRNLNFSTFYLIIGTWNTIRQSYRLKKYKYCYL